MPSVSLDPKSNTLPTPLTVHVKSRRHFHDKNCGGIRVNYNKIIWALSRENLSSGFPEKRVSN